MASTAQTFYKLNIQGIVYLVDPKSCLAYTYDVANPVEIGSIVWTNGKEDPKITYHPDWQARLRQKFDAMPDDEKSLYNAYLT